MSNGRHSFVAFYPSDWLGGTARMSRMHRSVYFDICCYIWDHAKPCPASELRLMLSDLTNWQELVDDLLASNKLERRPDGSITNPKAEAESQKALLLWQKRSQGGKIRAQQVAEEPELFSSAQSSAATEPEPEPEPEPETNVISFPNGKDSSVEPPLTVQEIVDGWNDLAEDVGLAKVVKLTDQRKKAAVARLKEYPDLASWQSAFRHIRNTPFLRGETTDWRASFDFLVQKSSFTKLVEGVYGKKQA